jgi:hypothetical protein
MKNGAQILFIASDSSRHLGLFDDLRGCEEIDLVFFPNKSSFLKKALTRVSPRSVFELAVKEQKIAADYSRIVVLDTALAYMDVNTVESLRRRSPEIRLLLLNSMEASSPTFEPVRGKLRWFEPRSIYSFDPHDVEKFGFRPLGLSYYSMHRGIRSERIETDCYFVGGLKGGRENLISATFAAIAKKGLRADFEVLGSNTDAFPTVNGRSIAALGRRWVPYRHVLDKVARTKTVVEILQRGQYGQSLRYFESITQGKKLLTTNRDVTSLPFYDERFMRVFSNPRDIDWNWLRTSELPYYDYNNEFSPLNLQAIFDGL